MRKLCVRLLLLVQRLRRVLTRTQPAACSLNGCKCGEHTELTKNYAGDIKSLHEFDFDGVKIDGCGDQKNQTLYAALTWAGCLHEDVFVHVYIEIPATLIKCMINQRENPCLFQVSPQFR